MKAAVRMSPRARRLWAAARDTGGTTKLGGAVLVVAKVVLTRPSSNTIRTVSIFV
jgi:hypothetical protein